MVPHPSSPALPAAFHFSSSDYKVLQVAKEWEGIRPQGWVLWTPVLFLFFSQLCHPRVLLHLLPQEQTRRTMVVMDLGGWSTKKRFSEDGSAHQAFI